MNSTAGRQLTSMAQTRVFNQLDPVCIDGLPVYVRQIEGSTFYDVEVNKKLKLNQVFWLQNEQTNQLLSNVKDWCFDATFCTSKPHVQLAIVMAKLKSQDPRRQDTIVPVFWSFMTSRSLDAYIELFDCFRSITPVDFVMKTISSDLESGIITSLQETFGGAQHQLDYWHLIRAWNTRLTRFTYLNQGLTIISV